YRIGVCYCQNRRVICLCSIHIGDKDCLNNILYNIEGRIYMTNSRSGDQKEHTNHYHSEQEYDNHEHHEHGSHGHQEHEHHDHGDMIAEFRNRFYLSLIVTIPILVLSPMIQEFIGVDWRFTNDQYILSILSTFVKRQS